MLARLEGFEPTTLGSEDCGYLCYLVPADSITVCLVWCQAVVCIWLRYLVPLGAKQFVGKMSAKWISMREYPAVFILLMEARYNLEYGR